MDEFFILSLKWTREDLLCWWAPKNSGYTSIVSLAGRYSRSDVEAMPGYYNNGTSTLAIPCTEVEKVAELVVLDCNLARLTGKRFAMKLDESEPCESCGNAPPATRLGLEIVGSVESTTAVAS